MALVYSAPTEARSHILRSAARQFEEGDVQHWWHPPSGIGVRTRITDDLYFLPLVVHHYVSTTGDVQLLDEMVPFIKSPVAKRRPGGRLQPARRPASSPAPSTSIASVRWSMATGLGSHGLPAYGNGRLERRHEQGRRRRQGGERVERLVLPHGPEFICHDISVTRR